jgi:hypothetical protein
MDFQLTPLSIPNMRTDYGAENSAFANLGATLGNLVPEMRKQQLDAQKQQLLGQLAGGTPDYTKVGLGVAALGDLQGGAALIGLGQKAAERDQRSKVLSQWGMGASGAPAAPSVAPASLVQNESGGAWNAQNNEVGAGGQRGHFGRLQFGQARLAEAAAAGAIPQGTTPQAFMASPELQQRAEAWHFADIDRFIQGNGLDKTIGRSINGVPVTLDGMRAVAHLGGKDGLAKFIASGGRYNPADANGTSLMDYFSRHGGSSAPVQVAQAPAQPSATAADVPAQGATETQFVIPGTSTPVASVPGIANDKNVQLWQQRYTQAAAAGDEKLMNVAKAQLEFATKEADRRYTEGKAPESVREWQWARQNGMTAAKSPTEYARELAAAKRDPDSDVTNLRKEVQQLPSYKNLAQAAPIYRSMHETAGRNSKASDLNLVYGLGKIMDPTSVVREGEMIMVKNSAGMSEQLLGAINALNGGAALTPETRQALMQEAYSRMNTYKGQFDQDMQQYRGIVSRRGYNADDVIPNVGEFSPYEPAPKAAGKGQPAPSAAAPALPQSYVDQYRRPDGSSPPLPSAPAAPAGPRRGELQDGYRFKGGDAADPKNWVKVK